MLYSLSHALHVLAAVIWVGGMFFAYVCLRPVLGAREPADRLGTWVQVFERFFPWVITSIGILFLTGFHLIYHHGGFSDIGHYIWGMLAIAVLMTGIFKFLYLAPYRHLRRGVEENNHKVAGFALGTIRKLVATNLVLGILVIVIATAFKSW